MKWDAVLRFDFLKYRCESSSSERLKSPAQVRADARPQGVEWAAYRPEGVRRHGRSPRTALSPQPDARPERPRFCQGRSTRSRSLTPGSDDGGTVPNAMGRQRERDHVHAYVGRRRPWIGADERPRRGVGRRKALPFGTADRRRPRHRRAPNGADLGRDQRLQDLSHPPSVDDGRKPHRLPILEPRGLGHGPGVRGQ